MHCCGSQKTESSNPDCQRVFQCGSENHRAVFDDSELEAKTRLLRGHIIDAKTRLLRGHIIEAKTRLLRGHVIEAKPSLIQLIECIRVG